MEYRRLGRTGWKVSTISMGCWALGDDWGVLTETGAEAVVRTALDSGINLFDTADGYGQGLSEERLGRTLGQVRKRVYIASKVGNYARALGHPFPFTSPYHVYGCCDASLHRLRSDYIDLYQCHIPAPKEPEIFLEAFERLLERGKIRAYGISTDSPGALSYFAKNGTCSSCQLNYSLLNRRAEEILLAFCQEKDIGVLVRGPLARGMLTGKYTDESRFQDRPRREWNEGAGRKRFLRQLETVELLARVKTGVSLGQAALAFILAHESVTTAIPGMKTPDQVQSNIQGGKVRINKKMMDSINSIVPSAGG